jgi:hypothetical protein
VVGSTASPNTLTPDPNWEIIAHVEPASVLFQIWLPEAENRISGLAGAAAAMLIGGRLAGNNRDALAVARVMRTRMEPPAVACVTVAPGEVVGKSSDVVDPTI